MLLTPSVLLKLNKRHRWGLCGEGMCEFMEAFPDGIEVTLENYKKIHRKFGYAIESLVEHREFDDASEEVTNKQGYMNTKFHADKFIEILNKLISDLDKPKTPRTAKQ